VDGLPRAVSRRKSDDCMKLEVEDILHLMDVLDEKCLLNKMPKCVAHDPSRLPPYNTADLDMGLLSLRVAALEEKLSLLSVSSQHVHVSTSTVVDSAATSNEVSAEEGHVSWADTARDLHVGDFHQVVRASTSATITPGQLIADQQKKPASRSLPPGPANTQRVLRGKRDEQGSIKGIPRRIGLYAFVSRLAKETTEDDLTGWLNNVGIQSAKCCKIVPKDGRVFQSAAFLRRVQLATGMRVKRLGIQTC